MASPFRGVGGVARGRHANVVLLASQVPVGWRVRPIPAIDRGDQVAVEIAREVVSYRAQATAGVRAQDGVRGVAIVRVDVRPIEEARPHVQRGRRYVSE